MEICGKNMVVIILYMVGYLASNTDSMIVSAYFGPLAQLAEQLTLNQQVQGSSPWRLIVNQLNVRKVNDRSEDQS